MKKKSLFFKLLISFLGLGIVCGFVGGLGYYGVSVLHKTADITLEQTEGGKLLTEKEIDHLNWRTKVGTFQRNESMTKIEVETDYHKCGFGKWFYGEDRKSLEKLIPELRVLFEKIEKPHQELHETALYIESLLQKGKEYRKEAITYYGEVTVKKMEEVQKIFQEMRDLTDQAVGKQKEVMQKEEERVEVLSITGIILGLIFSLVLGIFMSKKIAKPIKKLSEKLHLSSGDLHKAANQISSTSQGLSSASSELASSIEEMTSSMEELTSIIETNTKNINDSESLMRETMGSAGETETKMIGLTENINLITQSSQKIRKIIKTIDDIAFQTNILALNAAIEAARAGEAGKGFMVVAEQVKNLAQKSAEAAKETEYLIENALKNTEGGERTGKEAAEKLKKLVTMTAKVSKILQEVNSASKEQLRGANQVNEASVQINQVVQTAASSSEELSASGEELFEHSETILSAVEELNVLTEGEK